MKESYMEGVARRHDPESCVVGREAGGEALTGAAAKSGIELRNHHFRSPTLSLEGEGNMGCAVMREARPGPAESETRRMHRSSTHENREIPYGVHLRVDRSGKARSVYAGHARLWEVGLRHSTDESAERSGR